MAALLLTNEEIFYYSILKIYLAKFENVPLCMPGLRPCIVLHSHGPSKARVGSLSPLYCWVGKAACPQLRPPVTGWCIHCLQLINHVVLRCYLPFVYHFLFILFFFFMIYSPFSQMMYCLASSTVCLQFLICAIYHP